MPSNKPSARRLLDRAGVAELTGAAIGTVDRWYKHRRRFGFPERADATHWYEDDIRQFWQHYQQKRTATLARVDRTGDPSELVGSGEAARILGYNRPNDLPAALLDSADEVSELPSGRLRRTWRRRTLWQYADQHREDQRTRRPTGPKTPRGQADLNGPPDELVGPAEAARILGYQHQNHLPTHVLEAADKATTGPSGRTRRKWKRRTLWNLLRAERGN